MRLWESVHLWITSIFLTSVPPKGIELLLLQFIRKRCKILLCNIFSLPVAHFVVDYQHIFNFGLKTNIDLEGESRTASLVYNKDNMGPTELATNSFGQGYNVAVPVLPPII
mgnify:CR=1 FL=1